MNRSSYGAGSRVGQLRRRFARSEGLVFGEVLGEKAINEVLEHCGGRFLQRLFSPAVTLWAFLSQVLDTDKSCQKALSRVKAYLALQGQRCCGSTSAYCQARARLGREVVQRLCTRVAQTLEQRVTAEHLWCGRVVRVADGSGVSAPDTAQNQRAYPQPAAQKSGCGFPVLRLAVIFSLGSGALVAWAAGSLYSAELGLFRQIWDVLQPAEVLLGDRAYCSYCDMACLLARGIDTVARLNASRKLDPTGAVRLQQGDTLYCWKRPDKGPSWLEPKQFLALPEQLWVRVIQFQLQHKGFRPESITLCTTLLDSTLYPKEQLMHLYRLRWDAELDLRHIKTTLGMDVLRCRTPEMLLKEIDVFVLAYNLLRSLMFESAIAHRKPPLRISFKQTLQLLDSYAPLFAGLAAPQMRLLRQHLLLDIAEALVPDRPNRIEPRCLKRRPKPFDWLTTHRRQHRQVVAK
jgi:hypothetical protein